MAPSQEDVLFARFRRSGDPEALARVFDLTAPELLRVACHLAGQRATGEDLVQETFVAAIDTAARFDPGKAVLPWLLGILANHARRHHRDARRLIMAERLNRSAPMDPGAAAEEAEFRRALDDALSELPDTYREPIALHLRHGLSAREIADVMGRPAGTIRTYLVRGMEYLRRALPAGFAAGAAALCTPARGIAAVRAAVLDHARPLAAASAPLVAVSLLGGLFAMKKVLLAAGVLAALAAGYLIIDLASPAARDGLREDGAAPLAAADFEKRDSAPATRPALTSTERAVVPTDPTSTVPGSLLVRVVQAPEQTGAAGVAVVVTDSLATQWDYKSFIEGRTGEDGTVVLEGVPPGKVWVRTDRGPHARGEVRSGERGLVLVQLTEAMTLTGRVVDREGNPRPGAKVLFLDEHSRRALGRLLGHSGPDGRFLFRGIESTLSIWAEVAGCEPSPMQYASRDGTRTVEVTLVVGPAGHRLEGRVVDPSGTPVAHAPVAVGLKKPGMEEKGYTGYRWSDSFDTWPLRADAEGRFAVDWVPQGEILLLARDPDLVPRRRKFVRFTVQPGTVNRVEIRIADLPAVHGTLRDLTGKPIAGKHVSASWQQCMLSQCGHFFTDHGWSVSAEDGSFRIPGLLTGRYALSTRIENNSIERTVDLAEGQDLLWDPVLDRGQPATVRVVDAAGEPCKGWRVDWRQWETTTWGPLQKVLSAPVSEFTGEDGRASFKGLKSGTYLLLLHAPLRLWTGQRQELDRFPAVVHEGAQPGSGEIEVRVPKNKLPSVTLKGRVLGPEGEPLPNARVMWWRVDWTSGVNGFAFPADPATGAFEFGPVSPGTYVVSAKCEGSMYRQLPPREALPDRVLDLGEIRLQAPAFLEVTLRAAGMGALKDARVLLAYASGQTPNDGYMQQKEGTRYRSIPLGPGVYVLFACAEGKAPARREITLVSGREERLEIDLEPGLPCILELQFPPGRSGNPGGVLRVQDARGAIVFEENLWGYFNDFGKRIVRRRLSLAPGHYSVEADGEADTKCRGTSAFDVPATGVPDPILVQLR